jgi:NTP pyrophosphatase (non-canonical NTP hydrolase)
MKLWQRMAARWSYLVFGEHQSRITPKIRAMRILEEAIELAQAEGVTGKELRVIAAQVYSKSPGDPMKELGALMVTAANYAEQIGADLEEAFWLEYERILDPEIMARVRQRNLNGDKLGLQIDA